MNRTLKALGFVSIFSAGREKVADMVMLTLQGVALLRNAARLECKGMHVCNRLFSLLGWRSESISEEKQNLWICRF
jgi:hypothetical protein